MSAEDQECEKLYESTVIREENRYAVTLLLKPNTTLGESRALALRRLHCSEARFRKNSELQNQYVRFMDEYEQLGHMQLAKPLSSDEMHYYIPHHPVAIERNLRCANFV